MIRKLFILSLLSLVVINVNGTSPGETPLFKIRDVEKLLGRKLKTGEKIGLFIVRQKIKKVKSGEVKKGDAGKTAFILGLIGLAGLLIPVVNFASLPLAILAIVIGRKKLKEDPTNRKAKTAVRLGIITLAILLIVGFIVAAVLTFGTIGPR